jgi:hypothetical protein
MDDPGRSAGILPGTARIFSRCRLDFWENEVRRKSRRKKAPDLSILTERPCHFN